MLPLGTWAQIDVTATAGTPGPTSYGNLRLAFAAVNDGTHQGAITIDITASPGADNNTAVLNASGSGAADYASVLIRPAGTPGARTISGTIHAGPLVDLNGADQVTMDGRTAEGYGLTLSNQSTAATAGTSTVRFVQDATGNTLVDLVLLGRSTGAVGTLCGTVLFGDGIGTGNDGNTISHCTLANDGTATTDLVAQALVSIGSTANLDLHNSGNVVEHCLIHDFFLPAGSRGIHLGAGNHAWTIAHNRFFQGHERTTATANSTHHILHIGPGSHAEAGGHLIEGNVLGHANATGSGVWTLAGSTNRFRGIHLDVPNSAPRSSIRYNTIAGIQHTSSATGTGGSSPSTLVHVEQGSVDVLANTLGHADTTGNIVFTPSSTGRHFHGILNVQGTGLRVAHNTIGGITLNGTSSLYAIRNLSEDPWQCDSNTVGGAAVHSLQVTGTGTSGDVIGVASDSGALSAHGNTLRNLLCGNCQVAGMRLTHAALTATRDTISDLTGRYVEGIQAAGSKVVLEEVRLLRFTGTITTNSFASIHGVQVTNDTLVMTDCTVAFLDNPSTAAVSHVRGIGSVNAVVELYGSTIRRVLGMAPSATTRGVVAIHVDHGSLTAHGNAIDSLSNPNGHAVGIHGMDAPYTVEGNSITAVDGRTALGVLGERGPGLLTGNTIGPLTGVLTSSSNQTVTGIAVTDSGLVAHANLITTLSNGATGSSATVRGIHIRSATAMVTENTITALQGHGTGSAVAGVVGIHVEQGHLDAQHNTITALDNSSTWCMGMQVEDGRLEARNNTIGTLAARSVNGIHTLRSPASVQDNTISGLLGTMTTNSNTDVRGLFAQDSALVATGNTIRFLNNGATGGTSTVRGIASSEAPLVATGNTIAHLRGNGGGATVPGIAGVEVAHTLGHTHAHIAHNRIHTLHSTHASTSSQVMGIHAALRDTTNLIEANAIHALWRTTTVTPARPITGIHLPTGSSTVRNNMVALGTDSAGASVPIPAAMQGIHVAGGTHAILHNSVYIGGEAATASSNHTYALLNEESGTRDHRNNILWNARSNGAGSAKHYAVGVNASLTGLTSDHNCLYVSGTGGHVGREGTNDRSTLAAWQSATSLDGSSISTDPGFVRPVGDATEVDLHIQHNSAGAAAISSAGATGTGVLYDFDGAQRHSPPDIGADQVLLVLPDFYEEPEKPNYSYWHNKGQVVDSDHNPRPDVKFYTDGSLPRTYLRGGSTITFTHSIVDTVWATPDTTWRVDLRFTGGKERAVDPQPVDMRASYRNFYSPWSGPNGVTEVRGHGRVVYEDLYPFTDLHFYSGSGGPKLAFVIRPGGDLENIQLEFAGQDSLSVDGNGVLHAHVAGWDFPLAGGIAYQVDGGTIIPVGLTAYLNDAGSPVVDLGMSLFSSPADPELPLVIMVGHPPMDMSGGGGTANLTWSTTVGNDITAGLWGDYILGGDHLSDNDLIITGCTADPAFPLVTGINLALQVFDVFASRFDYAPGDPDNDAQVLWTSFIIGSGYESPTAIEYAVNHGKIYVSGYTNSTSWPMMPFNNPNDGSFHQSTKKGQWDGFILRLDQEGFLERSTLYGGNGDEIITTIVPDAYGQIYFWGITSSTTGTYASCNSPSSGLPLCNPGTGNYQQDNNAGGLDMFVARFNSSFQLGWGSFVGGIGDDRVIDADQTPNDNPALNRIALVGSTTNTLPYGNSGDFQLNSSGTNGFVWLFNSLGENLWGTHLNGTTEIQAVSFGSTMLRVMGLSDFSSSVSIENSCEAESGSLSICDGDDDLDFRAHYIAEFDLQQLGMSWSTLLNGYSDPSAEIAAYRYPPWALFDANRFMDMQTNGNDDFMVMGLVAKMDIGMMGSFPTQPMAGMYHKPFDPGMGNDQTEVFLALFSNEHERLWSTMFGSSFPHITTGDPGFFDWYYMDRGLDFGHSIVWVDGEVLYFVGSTGGLNFDRQCPYPFPGPSYCELTELPLTAYGESWDGMIARLDLQGINVGVPELPAHTGNALLIYPSPSDDMIYLDLKLDAMNGSRVMVFDATGRIALEQPYFHGEAISVRALSPGAYTLTLCHPGTGRSATGRFIRL